MKNFSLLLFVALLTPLAFAEDPSPARSYPIKAVATVGMIADAAQSIGGENLQMQTLIGYGGDPHLYKASPRDVMALAQADIIFYVGLFLEGKMAEILTNYSHQKPALAAGEAIPENLLTTPLAFAGHHDPHVWMDVSLWSYAVSAVRDKLIAFDPSHKTDYEKRAETYLSELARLHRYIRTIIASIPKEQRVLVTAHDAFNYFGRAYEIEVRGIQGISTESEAGLKDINDLVDFLVNRKIRAVFVESSVSQKNVLALIEGAKSRGHEIVVGGELYSDAMGAPNSKDGTYLGMLQHNAELITKSLGGKIPDGAFERFEK